MADKIMTVQAKTELREVIADIQKNEKFIGGIVPNYGVFMEEVEKVGKGTLVDNLRLRLYTMVLSPRELRMTVGETRTLTATILYITRQRASTTTKDNVTWSSNNEDVLIVDKSGKVTAKAIGKATVSVRTTDSAKTMTCEVGVEPVGTVIPVNYEFDQQIAQVNLY
ncbi:MAG: Ig-like domain-containing protein, partial [Lentimicrobiaceae bacterium]|nr:Ig-like domain-containing protein [Lentimicrobiaceae bacterium]